MKKTLLISALLLLFLSEAFDAHAQEKNKTILIPMQQEDTLVRYTWEIGTDLLWLIDKNILPATNIFIRKNLVTKNDRLTALRLRFGLDLNKMDSSQIWNNNPVERFHISPFMRIGHEWQAQVDRFQLFYGVDLHLLYSYNFERFEHTNRGTGGTGRINLFQVGPVGFIGIKYFLNSYLSLSMEGGYQALYESFVLKGRSTSTRNETHRTELSMNLIPIHFINFSYHF